MQTVANGHNLKKQKNAIQFEFKRHDAARALKYLKQTDPSKLAAKPLGYNFSLISMVGSSGSILHPSISQFIHVKTKALITNHLIFKHWEEVYSYHLEYDIPQCEGDEYDPIVFRQYLANITANMSKYARDQLSHAIYRNNDPTTVHFMLFTHHNLEATQVLN